MKDFFEKIDFQRSADDKKHAKFPVGKELKDICSCFLPDMRAERNILATDVYPYLRKFCSGLGLDFQVVDMRWGVTEDSQNDHSVEKLCLLEVENCQKTSRGPNFVVNNH